MYTFLINEDKTITASLTERIMQRSKLVDNLHFLADQTYKGVDISDYKVILEYVLPVSKRYKTEILQKSKDLYKNRLEYLLPFDTVLTSEAGDIEFQLDGAKQSSVSIKGTGITTVMTDENGELVVNTGDPSLYIEALTNSDIDKILST